MAAKVEVDDNGCWLWTGYVTPDGYSQLTIRPRRHRGHRLSYELLVGPIPEGREIDHLCRVRRCINPDHLEVVTRSENNRRSQRNWIPDVNGAPMCFRGHAVQGANAIHDTDGKTRCRTCRREARLRRLARLKQAA
jgi:hypothetical protein